MMKKCLPFLICTCLLYSAVTRSQSPEIRVDLDHSVGAMTPIWAWFGHDEPNYTYMKDGKKLLTELSEMSPVPVYIRTHNLLTTGDGTASLKWGSTNAYTEDANGQPVYSWNIIDSIFDTYMQRGIKPLVQIGFMPEALSTNPEPYRHNWEAGNKYTKIFTGWTYPPKDYKKWEELVYQWALHSLQRYGKPEVESWYWEVWNEPNIGYWGGTVEEYCKLYDFAANGLRRAIPSARIGGCNITGGGSVFLRTFLNHCLHETNFATGMKGSPLDLVLFHAKGQPRFVDGRVVMNAGTQMRNIRDAIQTVNEFPELKGIPLVVGESDPEGCAACGMNTNPENAYRNGTMYSSYTAATFAREYQLADALQANLIGAVSWSFEFEDQPWFAGFRDLATNGVDKPVLNVFRMFGMMQGERVRVTGNRMYGLDRFVDSSVRGTTDVGALAARSSRGATIMVWNYHDEDRKGVPEVIDLQVSGLPGGKVRVIEYRIDDQHSNSYEVWKRMGSPAKPDEEQVRMLEEAGKLESLGRPQTLNGGKPVHLRVFLPRQGVSLFTLTW